MSTLFVVAERGYHAREAVSSWRCLTSPVFAQEKGGDLQDCLVKRQVYLQEGLQEVSRELSPVRLQGE